jgi:transposase-like protein
LHPDVKYLPQMADEDKRRYLFVAIERAMRWVCPEVFADKTALAARRLLHHLHKACPIHSRTILTDNNKVSPTGPPGRMPSTGAHCAD